MDRSRRHFPVWTWGCAFLLLAILLSTGCLHSLLATGIYIAQGGNLVPAEFSGLENHRVVVVCRPPSVDEFRYPGASRNIARRVSQLLRENVRGIDMVDPREVDNWADESDWSEFKELGQAVEADFLVHIELDDFSLLKGRTLYQGDAQVTITVYDMQDHEKIVWERQVGQVLYPRHSGIPAQDKSVHKFQQEFEDIVATIIAVHFYKHDPHATFAIDALANR
ncbi:MAG: hypothetical protein JW829_14100 [Pirellulales bacterium]|nr:hypothetical protein [Pirellulales bacterium]